MTYDIIGNIAVLKGDDEDKSKKQRIKEAKKILERPSVETVVEKSTNVQGRLRTIKTTHLAGKKNLIADYKENNCRFKFNVEDCYFSTRLSGERKLIAEKISHNDKVLVMFAGVAVYPIVIYKTSHAQKIVSIELGRECSKWAVENLKLNKIPKGKIEIVQGDVKKKIGKDFEKFDVVVMARPNLQDTFLEWGLNASKKNTRLFYYGFCNKDEIDNLVKELVDEGKRLGRKLKVSEVVRAGDIAPYKFRYRIEFKVMN